jgi:hypothetical protein
VAHDVVPIRFRFIKLPVTWEVLSGDRLARFRTTQLRALEAKQGKELTGDQQRALERRARPGPFLCGQIKGIRSLDEQVLTELDGWYWRDRFFALDEHRLDDVVAFLNEVGAWPSEGGSTPGHHMDYPVLVQPETLWLFREDLQCALLSRDNFINTVTPQLTKAKTWLDLYRSHSANEFTMSFELMDVAAGVVTITNARHMLFATVLADLARSIRFKTCARTDCGKPFPIENKHKRKFCTQYCGHLVSQRKKRLAEQKQRRAERRASRKKTVALIDPLLYDSAQE